MKVIKATNESLILKQGNLIISIFFVIVTIPFAAYLFLVAGVQGPDSKAKLLLALLPMVAAIIFLRIFAAVNTITFDKIHNNLQITTQHLFRLFIPKTAQYDLFEIVKIYFERREMETRETHENLYKIVVGLKNGRTIPLGREEKNFAQLRNIAELISKFLGIPLLEE